MERADLQRGGTYIVDIRDPADPEGDRLRRGSGGSIHGEGAHVVTYKGRDILAVNNEPCTFAATGTGGPGGFDLIDVTDPCNPVKLGAPGGRPAATPGPTTGRSTGTEVPHSNHSTVMWEYAGRAVPDHGRQPRDPRRRHPRHLRPGQPEAVAEYDLLEQFPQIEDSGNIGSFAGTFHHDTKVKIINGQVDREHVLLGRRLRRRTTSRTRSAEVHRRHVVRQPEPLTR